MLVTILDIETRETVLFKLLIDDFATISKEVASILGIEVNDIRLWTDNELVFQGAWIEQRYATPAQRLTFLLEQRGVHLIRMRQTLLQELNDSYWVQKHERWYAECVVPTMLRNNSCWNYERCYRNIMYNAICNDEVGVVRRLLEWGANVNIQFNIGRNPLFLAIDYKRLGIIELLLKRGASLTVRLADMTAVEFAIPLSGGVDIIRMLHMAGADMRRIKSSLHKTSANVLYIRQQLNVGGVVLDMMTDRRTWLGRLPMDLWRHYIDPYFHGSIGRR